MVAEVRASDPSVNINRSAEQAAQAAEVNAERNQATREAEQKQEQRSVERRSAEVTVSSSSVPENPQANRVEQSNEVTRNQLNGLEPKANQRETDSGAIKEAELASQEAKNQIQEKTEDALKAQANQKPEVVLDLLS